MIEQLKLFWRTRKYRYLADRQEIAYLLKQIRKGDTVVDVGAHKGAYTYWMKKAMGPSGKLIAFEPQKKGAALLSKLFADRNTVIEHKALSDRPGFMPLFIQPQHYDVSFEASLESRYENARQEMVEVTTLDRYCTEQGLRPAFIKIDVEGHELQVIRGGSALIESCRPVLMVETEERHTGREKMLALFEYLQDRGYGCYFFRSTGKTSLADFDVKKDQDVQNLGKGGYHNNFVFEPRNRFEPL